jgi:hypothetical protein
MLDAILASLLGREHLDERFIAHRHRSSRLALGTGVLLLAGWASYDLVVHDVIRQDFMVILLAMAVTKVGAMIFFRLTQ